MIYTSLTNVKRQRILKSYYCDELLKSVAAIGEIRNWNGIDYQKVQNGVWKVVGKNKNVASSTMMNVVKKQQQHIRQQLDNKYNEIKQKWQLDNNKDVNSSISAKVAFEKYTQQHYYIGKIGS